MKDVLSKLLSNAEKEFLRGIPKYGISHKEIDISDVEPRNLTRFMNHNKIPMDAYFSGIDNGYDGFSAPSICWEVKTTLDEDARMKLLKQKFHSRITAYVVRRMRLMGYEEIRPVVIKKHLMGRNLYDLYKDEDHLIEYFCCYFKEA